MITVYARRDRAAEADEVRRAFEWGRLGLIERAAGERGLEVRRLDEWGPGAPGGGERVEVTAEIDFDNDALPEVEDLVDRLTLFLYDVDDGCLGRLRCAVDTGAERRFVEGLDLGNRPVIEAREGRG